MLQRSRYGAAVLEYYQKYGDIVFYVCVGGLIGYMLFIIYKLAEESKAGKFGMLVLFIALGLGMFGFIAKAVIQAMIE